jgi:hypothetical protein
VNYGPLGTALCCLATVAAAGGQEVRPAPQPAASQPAGVSKLLTPLKITVVISRYQGDKRTGSLPFTLFVNTDGQTTNLRMGAEVPVPSATFSSAGGQQPPPVTSYQYRSIGTNIDCSAVGFEDGRYRLLLSVQDSQVFSDAGQGSAATQGAQSRAPASFQNFTSTTTLVIRDGQTIQYTTATDKASGEVIKIDATLNVVK